MNDLLNVIHQMGVDNVRALVRLTEGRKHRDRKVGEWYRQFTYQTFYEVINNQVDVRSSRFRMKLMFVTNFGLNRIRGVLNDVLTTVLFTQ